MKTSAKHFDLAVGP